MSNVAGSGREGLVPFEPRWSPPLSWGRCFALMAAEGPSESRGWPPRFPALSPATRSYLARVADSGLCSSLRPSPLGIVVVERRSMSSLASGAAVQDEELRVQLRRVPGCPLLFVSRTVLVMEQPSGKSKAEVQRAEVGASLDTAGSAG